jgi:hypothetical protein
MAEFILDQEATKQRLLVVAGLVVAIAAMTLFAISVAKQDIFMVMILTALAGFVIVFPFPKLAIVIVILFAQIQYLFTSYYGSLFSYPILPRPFQWLDEVVLLALLGHLALRKMLKKESLERVPGLVLLAVLFAVGLASTKLNEIGLRNGLIGQRWVFEMVILYLAITNLDLDERFLRNLVYLLLGIGVFQAAVGILEFVARFRLYAAGNHDIVQGTWGGGSANRIGIFFLCLSAVALARLRRRLDAPKAMLFSIYILLLVLSSCRTGIVLAPAVILFVLREKLKNPKYWIAATIALVFLAAMLAFYYKNTDAELGKDLGGDEVTFQLMGRTGVIPVMAQVLRDNSKFPPFGAGPGTYFAPAGEIFESKIFMQVTSMTQTRTVVAPFMSASYAVVWMEYGIVGLILFVMILLRFFVFAWRTEKSVVSLFWKDYLRALQAIILIYTLVGGVFALWTHFQSSIYLWLFSAIGVRYGILEKQRAQQADEVDVSYE